MPDNNWTLISGSTSQDYTDTMVFEMSSETKKVQTIMGQALVAGEENSQYIKFVLDRFWDGIDISGKTFSIEYALSGLYYGTSEAVNAEMTTDKVRFGWIVPETACCVSGKLLFVIRVESEDYILKSQIVEVSVYKTINVEDVVPEPTREAWYREFEARVNVAIADAEAALAAAQTAQGVAENAVQNAQTAEANAEAAAAAAQIRYGSPLTAAEADQMIDENRVYVYTGSESGYTAGNWYYYDGSAWTSGGVYNGNAINTDTTLTQAGMAADAKETGDQITELKSGISELQDGGYVADAQKIQEKIDKYLDEHPEATTTVQDGALSELKFSNALKLKTIKDYVTPEMYGAKGDGETDDTDAIQKAINNVSGLDVYFSPKVYLTTEPVYLKGNKIINDGEIRYTGEDYALVLKPETPLSGAYYNLGTIRANNGGCLNIDSSGAWLQYLNFDFLLMSGNTSKSIVMANVVGNNWINEIRFNMGRFANFLNAVYIDHETRTASGYTSHWTFDKIGFEGGTNGVNIPSSVTRMSFTNCRAEESITNVVYSRATAFSTGQTIVWFGVVANLAYWQNAKYYIVTMQSGVITKNGVLLGFSQVLLHNNNIYGISYKDGTNADVREYGAYSYDESTGIQEIDFAIVYDYTTIGTPLNVRPFARRFLVYNNAAANQTDIYLDSRMWLNEMYTPVDEYLLVCTLSPNKILNIYATKGGTLLYSATGASSTTYPRIKISKANKVFYIERSDGLVFKSE